MTELETVNARITGTELGICDHGMMNFWVALEWKGGGQSLGGYALDQGHRESEERTGFGPGFIAIRKILETAGVERWEDLKGKLVRLKVGGPGSSRPPVIGHIIEDKWFDLKSFMEQQE